MDIHTTAESLLHSCIARNMGKDTQFDLAVVRIYQDTTRLGNKHFPNLRAQISPHGDILQIGLSGRKPTGSSYQILECGMNATILTNSFHQAFCIGGVQLCKHPVIHNRRDNGVLIFQFLQHFCIGGITGFCLLNRRQTQLIEKQLTQLFGRIDIKRPVSISKNQSFTISNTLRKHFTKLFQLLLVNSYAGFFHLVKHRAKRQLDLIIQAVHSQLLQFTIQHRI